MTRRDIRALQHFLNHFTHKYGLGLKSIKEDGVPGPETHRRIMTAKFFLGYGKDRDASVKSLFVRRLRHPHSLRFSTPRMLATGASRRAARRRELSHGGKARALKLYRQCQIISNAGGPYLYGGGHGPLLRTLRSGQGLDCSSSTSLALWRSGLFPYSTAIVSSGFGSWGTSGEGRYFTIWENAEHVWVQFRGLGSAWRFDTSPHNCGGYGPRMRTCSRFTGGFVPRHYPGL